MVEAFGWQTTENDFDGKIYVWLVESSDMESKIYVKMTILPFY